MNQLFGLQHRGVWNDVFSREIFAQNSVTINPCKSGSLLLLALQVYAEMSHHLTKQ